MRTLAALLLFLHATTAWGGGPGRELTEKLVSYLTDGSTGEKALALSLLPGPGCGERESAGLEDLFIRAMIDSDPLVREMAVVAVRRSFGSANQNPPFHVADPGRSDVLSPLPPNPSLKRVNKGIRTAPSSCGSQRLFEALKQAAADAVPRIRAEAAVSLGITGRKEALPPLISLTNDKDPFVRTGAAFGLGLIRSKEGIGALSSLVERTGGDWRDFFARREGLKALQRIWVSEWTRGVRGTRMIGPEGAGDIVTEERIDPAVRSAVLSVAMKAAADPDVRKDALSLLAEIRAPEALDLFRASGGDGDPVVRVSAIRGLARIAGQKDVRVGCYAVLARASADVDPGVRRAAMAGLGEYAGEDSVDVIMKGLKDPDREVRTAAAAAFRVPSPKALEALAGVLAEKSEMRSMALKSLYGLTREKERKVGGGVPPASAPALVKQGKKVIMGTGFSEARCSGRFRPSEPGGRLRNDRVVGMLMALYDSFPVEEKAYALEILQRFEDDRIIPFLVRAMNDREEQITLKAMEAAALYSGKETYPAIARHAGSDDARVSAMVREIFPCLRERVSASEARWMAGDTDPEVRRLFFETYGGSADPGFAETCLRGLRDPSEGVRAEAARCFVRVRDPRAVPVLAEMLASTGQDAVAAATALAVQEDPGATTALLGALARADGPGRAAGPDIRREVVAALGLRDETEEITPVILRLLRKEPDGPLAPDLLKTLGSLRDSRAVPYLLDYVRARYKYDVEALYALANIRDPAALNELKRIVDDPACPQRRRSAAVYSLVMTSGEGGMETLLDVIERHAELRPEVARYIWISTDSARRMVAAAAGRSPTSYRDYFRHINEAQRSWIKAKYSGKLLHDTDPYVVRGAVLLLEASKDPQAVAELRGIQGAGDPALNGLVTEAIETLSGAGKPARR